MVSQEFSVYGCNFHKSLKFIKFYNVKQQFVGTNHSLLIFHTYLCHIAHKDGTPTLYGMGGTGTRGMNKVPAVQ